MTYEPKRAKFTDTEEALIAVYAVSKYPKMHRTQLAEKILSEIPFPGKSPEVEVLERKISKARAHELSPIDKPFSLGALVECVIPPSALPMVLRVWAGCNGEADGFSWSSTFSIRDALWVGRLSRLFNDPETVWGYALLYSVRQRAYEAIGKAIDTTDIDEQLLKNFKPMKIVGRHEND